MVCFQFSAFRFESQCIICLQKIEDFGQWAGNNNTKSNTGYVLENCAHYNIKIGRDICQNAIKNRPLTRQKGSWLMLPGKERSVNKVTNV